MTSKLDATSAKLRYAGFLLLLLSVAHASEVNWLETPLAGADQDLDGVRDDVGTTLKARYKDAAQRRWPMEIARSGQRYVTSNGNPFAIYRAHAEMQRAMGCLTEDSGQRLAERVKDEVLAMVLNTDVRKQSYAEAVSKWEQDVRHRTLPARPDDSWQAACTPSTAHKTLRPKVRAARPVKVAPAESQSSKTALPAVEAMDELPPPNFFLTNELPEKKSTRVVAPRNEPSRAVEPDVAEDEATLPNAFRVQPRPNNNRLSNAFIVGAKPAVTARPEQKEAAAVVAALPPELAKPRRHSQDPVLNVVPRNDRQADIAFFNQMVSAPVPTVRRLSLPQPKENFFSEPEAHIQPLAALPPSEKEEVEERVPTDSDEPRRKTELVVVVQKGEGAEEKKAAEEAPPLLLKKEAPVLPPVFQELAPFIKSFQYQ